MTGGSAVMGRIPRDERLLALGYRILVVDEYLAFYVRTPEAVLVHGIVHGARGLRGLFFSAQPGARAAG